MEFFKVDFKVEDKAGVFTPAEIEMIDASVNGFKLPKDHLLLKRPIMKKLGVRTWPHAIAMMFKVGVVKSFCFYLALTIFTSSFSDDINFRNRTARRSGSSQSKAA